MTVKIDISELAEQLGVLHERATHHSGYQSIAVVVPLEAGRADIVREYLAEGPPFDPAAVGLEGHKVFVTDREAVFVFETEEGVQALERLLAEPELWEVVSAWERSAAEEPRVGVALYEWPEHRCRPAPVEL